MENEKYTPSEKNGKWGCVDNKGNMDQRKIPVGGPPSHA